MPTEIVFLSRCGMNTDIIQSSNNIKSMFILFLFKLFYSHYNYHFHLNLYVYYNNCHKNEICLFVQILNLDSCFLLSYYFFLNCSNHPINSSLVGKLFLIINPSFNQFQSSKTSSSLYIFDC